MKKRNLIIIITSFLTVILIITTIVAIKCISHSNEILILNTYFQKSDNSEKEISYNSTLRIIINPQITYKEYEIKYKSLKGIEADTLLKNCYSLYTTYWKKLIKSYPDQTKKYKVLVENPEADIKIKNISGNIAIIERTHSVYEIDQLIKVDDIWYYKDDMWKRFNDFSNEAYLAQLLYLNNDEYIDAIITGGCCDTNSYNILIGDKDNIFINTQNINYHGFTKLDYKEKEGSQIICKPYPEDSKSSTHILTFNVQKNMFINK